MEHFLNELTLSVIIPVHYGGENFRRCLSSIAAAVPPANEIIVVADGDTDGSWHFAEEFGAQVLRVPVPQGPAHARNFGAQSAQGDILFFIDADVVIPPDAISKVKSTFNNNPQLAALFGSYDDEPAEMNFLSQYKNLIHHYVHQMSREEASTFWAGCGAIRRQIFMEFGGFDESYRKPSIEDIELGYRLKRAGYHIRLSKCLQVKHLKRWGIMLTYGLLLALIGGLWWPELFAVACVLILSLLIINAPVYCFFLQKRGLWFMIRTLPWHWFYYFYSGLAFAIGLGRSLLFRHRYPKPGLSAATKGLRDRAQFPECR
jgi:glycosyltransferase involved in cell wall biosynthesis